MARVTTASCLLKLAFRVERERIYKKTMTVIIISILHV